MFSYRKFANFLLFIISILIVNLITTVISDLLFHYMRHEHPLKATLLGMVLTVFVLYPAYSKIDDISASISKNIFTAGKNAAGKFLGLLWAFGVAFAILFACYLYLWFDIKFWNLI